MYEVKNIKICPLYNHNFEVLNKDELIDMIRGIPIITRYDYRDRDRFSNCVLIGFVSPNSSIRIKDNFLTSDVYFVDEEYKDYEFINYEIVIDNNAEINYEDFENNRKRIARIYCIVFDKCN